MAFGICWFTNLFFTILVTKLIIILYVLSINIFSTTKRQSFFHFFYEHPQSSFLIWMSEDTVYIFVVLCEHLFHDSSVLFCFWTFCPEMDQGSDSSGTAPVLIFHSCAIFFVFVRGFIIFFCIFVQFLRFLLVFHSLSVLVNIFCVQIFQAWSWTSAIL